MDDHAVEQERKKRIAQRGRAAQLVAVALFAGFVGAAVGYFKGEVAVIEGNSQVASVLATEIIVGAGRFAAPSISGAVPNPEQKPKCIKGTEPECRNRCSTTYLKATGESNRPFEVIQCFDKNSEGKKRINALALCIKNNGYAGEATSPTFLTKHLCEVPIESAHAFKADAEKVGVGSTGSEPAKEIKEPTKKSTIAIPKACAAQLKAVQELYTSPKTPTRPQKSEAANECADFGGVTCIQTKPEGQYQCIASKDGATGAGVNAPPGSIEACLAQCKATGRSDLVCSTSCAARQVQQGVRDLASKLRDSATQSTRRPAQQRPPQQCPPGTQPAQQGTAQMVLGIVGSFFGGGGQQQPQCAPIQKPQQQPPQCPNGYTLSTAPQAPTSGAIVYRSQTGQSFSCVPDAKAPTCVFNVSNKTPARGTKVTLTWDTKNTEGGRVMLKDGAREGRTEAKGSQEITAATDITYTLTAYNRAGDTKECKVDIKVSEGGGGDDDSTRGKLPPRVSCTPSIIEPGRSATVTWQCPNVAKKSAGEGLRTGGDITGEKTVTPDGNTEYTISCFSSNDANVNDEKTDDFLGKRTCSVRVAEPTFDMIAYPESAGRGDRVRISWGSLFMQSCEVTGPRGFAYDQPSGVVVTEPFSEDEASAPDRTITAAVYTIVCESVFGDKSTKDVTVEFDN